MSRNVGNSLIFNAATRPGETRVVDLMKVFNDDPNHTVCICATVNEDGTPHSAPVTLILASDERTLMLGLGAGNVTTQNIKRVGWAILEVLGPDDLAVGIKGKVKIIKEPMDFNPAMVVGEMAVESIKQDTSPAQVIVSGASIRPRSERGKAFEEAAVAELKRIISL